MKTNRFDTTADYKNVKYQYHVFAEEGIKTHYSVDVFTAVAIFSKRLKLDIALKPTDWT